MTATTPTCCYCGRPAIGQHVIYHVGRPYHPECTRAPRYQPTYYQVNHFPTKAEALNALRALSAYFREHPQPYHVMGDLNIVQRYVESSVESND